MSNVISVFVDSGCTLADLVECVEQATGVRLERLQVDNKQLFRGVVMGALVDVFDEHDLVDDLGIAFTRYPFEIDVEVTRSAVLGDYASDLLRLVPMILGNAVSQKLGCECMVVENHQRVVKTFG